jgi:hypothetical protein
MIRIVYWASDGKKRNIEAEDEDDLHRQIRDIEKDPTKLQGLFAVIRELYGQDPKCKPEDVVEAAWKAVPKYTWWRSILDKFKRIFSFTKR